MDKFINWLNSNEGFVDFLIFICTLFLGWVTGIFQALAKRPKFKIRVIPKMTFGTVYETGEKYTPQGLGTYDVHKTAFVLYLEIVNIGSAPSNIGLTEIGYYKDDGKSTWLQKRMWIKETNILDRFSIPTGDGQELRLPFLKQRDPEIENEKNSFLEVGQSIIGTNYFEQTSSWGNHYPRINDKLLTEIKVRVFDSFGNNYTTKANVPIKSLEVIQRYNSKFGFTEKLFDKDFIEDINFKDSKENKGGEK